MLNQNANLNIFDKKTEFALCNIKFNSENTMSYSTAIIALI